MGFIFQDREGGAASKAENTEILMSCRVKVKAGVLSGAFLNRVSGTSTAAAAFVVLSCDTRLTKWNISEMSCPQPTPSGDIILWQHEVKAVLVRIQKALLTRRAGFDNQTFKILHLFQNVYINIHIYIYIYASSPPSSSETE